MCTELPQGTEAEGTFPAGAGTSQGRDQESPQGRDQLPQLGSEGFHLIKGNRKASPRVEAVPIWLRRWALLQLAARKGEYWEMRSLGVMKAPRCTPLPGWGWLLSSSSSCSAHGVGSRAVGLRAQLSLGHSAWHSTAGAIALPADTQGPCESPLLSPPGLGEPIPHRIRRAVLGARAGHAKLRS